MRALDKQFGFTLIELLVVMVLLGLLTSLATTSIGGNQVRELEIETNRLHALLRSAANEAVFSNTEIGVLVAENEYGFVVYDESSHAWVGSNVPLLAGQVLPEWMYLEFEREGESIELPVTEPDDRDADFGEEESKIIPDFMLLSSGEVTNFTLTLGVRDDSEIFREVTVNEFGEIILPHLQAINDQ